MRVYLFIFLFVFIGCTHQEDAPSRDINTNMGGRTSWPTIYGTSWPNIYTGATRFESLRELSNWAKSSVFGGHVEEFLIGGKKVFVVDRSWTSGVFSSEIGVYVPDGEELVLRYSTPPMHMFYHKFKVENGDLIIIRGDNARKEYVIKRLSAENLFGS